MKTPQSNYLQAKNTIRRSAEDQRIAERRAARALAALAVNSTVEVQRLSPGYSTFPTFSYNNFYSPITWKYAHDTDS